MFACCEQVFASHRDGRSCPTWAETDVAFMLLSSAFGEKAEFLVHSEK